MATKWISKPGVLLYALLLVIGLSGPLTFISQGEHYLHRDYYRTSEFADRLNQFASYLNLFELNSFSPEEAKSLLTVQQYEILNYRDQRGTLAVQTQSLREEYETLIQGAVIDDDRQAADAYVAQRDIEMENLAKVFKDDDYVAALIRKEKEQRIDSYFAQRENYRSEYNALRGQFDYFFRNASTGAVHTNLSAADERTARRELFSSGHDYAGTYTVNAGISMHYFIEGHELLDALVMPYQGLIAVPTDSPLRDAAKAYRRDQMIFLAYTLIGTLLLVYCLLRFKAVMSVQSAGTSRWRDEYRRMTLDVKLLLIAGTAALTLGFLENFLYLLEYQRQFGGRLFIKLLFTTGAIALTLIQGKWLAHDRLRDRDVIGKEWQRSLTRRGGLRLKAAFEQAINHIQASFIYKNLVVRLLGLVVVMVVLGFIGGWTALAFLRHNDASFFLFAPLLAIVGLVALFLMIRQIGYLNQVTQAAEELAAGRIPYELPRAGSGALASLASHINALRKGFKTLQNEQAKSERMKTELITNVSHDLRTPLTSIITYTELLKSEDATPEERAAYVEIIDQKSKRLQTMIDDLFEVSTMASGNAQLMLERTDLVQLMQQALGEYKEAMDDSDVQFRISLPEGPIYAVADGQKLWRAFDNLIGNMLKYAMAHTRAYISMQRSERDTVTIAFKNVSKYEIGDNADELLERFKRGDTSRHMEGSGLGLAIAKSIVDLHEGRLTLEADGDLFKATVQLRIAN